MIRKFGPHKQPFRPRRGGKPRHILWRLTKVCGHPDAAKLPAGEGSLEHLVAVGRLHQQTIAFFHAVSVTQGSCKSCRTRFDLGPCPFIVTPDKADVVWVPPRAIRQKLRQVHNPGRNGHHYDTRSKIEA